jgi:hypothetical protein
MTTPRYDSFKFKDSPNFLAQEPKMMWPSAFTSPSEEWPSEHRKKWALANQLCAWGNCMSGVADIPKNFGEVMAALGAITGAYTPQRCMEASTAFTPSSTQPSDPARPGESP